MTAPSQDSAALLAGFERHLRAERNLSGHTVRAYVGDIHQLLDFVAEQIGERRFDVSGLDLPTLRSWLAGLRAGGASRATMARRAAAARTFLAWAHRAGLVPEDVGALLATPKRHRALPAVLQPDEVRALLDVALVACDDGSPVGLRDRAVLEVLYAAGIRVGELVGLDVDDIDHDRRVLRVIGKGDKERAVPYGEPAADALDDWLTRGRPRLVRERSGPALFL
ncbi:MAG TPA: tyrosine-type recombinase/integrase, partial [Actinopolymorphaceae bacterium]